MKFTKLMPILVGTIAASLFAQNLFAQKAIAQNESEVITVNDVFERAFFNKSGDAYYNTNIWRQFNAFFGVSSFPEGSYPDNELVRDAENINELYREIMHQQVSSDPIIRTQDLPNPYGSSLLSNPEYMGFR